MPRRTSASAALIQEGDFFTVSLQVAFFPLWVLAVMVALPAPTAVTSPLASTVATFLLLVAQVIVALVSAGIV